jgi:glycosyltransferase involved in cell wall biosynthesis
MAKKTKNSFPSASIIIPAYNAEKTLQTCLDALLQQTIHPEEIIVVDDGSTDSTRTIAESFSLVTLLSQKNQGPANARNVGAKKARGDIILFIDSDCIAEKNWLEEMLKPFEDEKVVGVQGAYKTKQKSPIARFDQMDIEYRYERMKKKDTIDWIGTYSAAYQRKVFMEAKGFDETFPKASGEDSELSYRLAEKGMILKFAPSAIVYHTHPHSLLHYLRVKFFRAYWRTRMYVKHPKKSVQDSYTPHVLKINFFVGGLFILVLAYLGLRLLTSDLSRALIVSEMVQLVYFLLLIFLVIVIALYDFLLLVAKKDLFLVPYAVILIFLRSIVFVLGAGFGLLDWRVWK